MKWVRSKNAGADRTACVSLFRNRIDRQAKFWFVPVGQTKDLTKRAEPFDLPGVRNLGFEDDPRRHAASGSSPTRWAPNVASIRSEPGSFIPPTWRTIACLNRND
jgi:hypothetical protein